MAMEVRILRHGGYPLQWALWGKGNVKPGEAITIGSGMGPFFAVIGVQDGACFQYGQVLNIALKVNGVSSQVFILNGGLEAGEYMALVSKV
jgi:hypothetical protein